MTKLAALQALEGADHAFLGAIEVEEITDAFGFKGSVYRATSDPAGTFKGLTLAEGLEEAWGQDAAVTAEQVASHLGLRVPGMLGRGSRLRAACAVIRKHLETTGEIQP